MDGPGRGGDLRLRRAGPAREPGARRRQGLQSRAHHRRHSRRIARAPLRNRLRRRRVEFSDEIGLRRRDPDRARGAAKNRIVALERAHPDGDRVFSADHPRGAVAVFGTGGFARRDRRAARRGLHRRRAAQPDARRALRLCHHARVFGAIRVRKFARPAGHREARGRWTARPDQRSASRRRRAGVRVAGGARAEDR